MQEILKNKKSYINHPVGKYLLKFLNLLDKRYIQDIGYYRVLS